MRLIKLLCLLSMMMPLILAEEECRGFIQQLASQRNNQNYPYQQYFASSGIHGVLDLGDKTKCELNDKMKYFVLVLIIPAPPSDQTKGWRQQENGICVPQYCTKEILSNDQGLLKQLSSVNGWNAQSLILHDPNGTSPREPLYYVLMNLFYFLVGLCIVSTIVQAITKTAENHFSKGTTKKNYSVWLFKSFDLIGNLKSLWKTAEESGQSDHIATFNLIRILAIIWIIAFHAIGRNFDTFKYNGGSTHPAIDDFIRYGDLAPGYFFFMGGFLATYTVASKAARETGSGLVGFFSDIFHRFLKIYPGVCVAILCYWIVTPGLLNGTLWGRYHGVVQVCAERWQDKFLMRDNFHFPQLFDWCASWTWYMNVDFQLYPLIVFIGYVAIQSKCFKYVAYIGIIVLGYYSVDIGLERIREAQRVGRHPYWDWYVYPPARAFELLIGAFFGLQYYEYAKLKLRSNFIAWCESFGDLRYISVVAGAYINYYCIFTPWNLSGWSEHEWHYFKRVYTGIGTALFLMPLANDAPSVIKAIMNLRIFQILGKLCFGVYLLHWPLQLVVNYRTEHILDRYDSDLLLYKIKLNVLHSFLAAFVYYLVLEKPLLNIESHFTKRQKPAAAVQAETPAASIQYKVLSELPDQEADVSMAEQYSVMDASTMRGESPMSPDNKSVRSMRSTKSTRSTRQVGDSISIVHDVEMGKFDHYEDRELEKSRHIALSRNPSSPSER